MKRWKAVRLSAMSSTAVVKAHFRCSKGPFLMLQLSGHAGHNGHVCLQDTLPHSKQNDLPLTPGRRRSPTPCPELSTTFEYTNYFIPADSPVHMFTTASSAHTRAHTYVRLAVRQYHYYRYVLQVAKMTHSRESQKETLWGLGKRNPGAH